eukprot:gene3698-3745_t
MDHGTLALLVPLLALAIPIVAIWTTHQRRVEEIRAKADVERADVEKAGHFAAQTSQLEERVRVLERIITDRGTSLAQEIEALRADEGTTAQPKKLQ